MENLLSQSCHRGLHSGLSAGLQQGVGYFSQERQTSKQSQDGGLPGYRAGAYSQLWEMEGHWGRLPERGHV